MILKKTRRARKAKCKKILEVSVCLPSALYFTQKSGKHKAQALFGKR